MNKVIGYFLSCIGLMMVFFALISMFKVFTGAQLPIQLVNDFSFNITTQYGPIAVDGSKTVGFVNLALHAVFMFFIVATGGRLCAAGTGFIRTDYIAGALKHAKIEDIKKL